MTTKQAIKLAGSRRALASLLGVSVQATHRAAWRRALPPLRVIQLRTLRPEWFA